MEVSLGSICSLSKGFNSSLNSFIWELINQFQSYYLIIASAILIWIIFELLTRNGKFHYNSANGFSPYFNSFVGSGLYCFYYGLVLIFPHYVLGDIVYCVTLPVITHLLIFLLVKKTLVWIKFWKY